MADNTTLNAGAGGDVIATDDLGTMNGGAVTGIKVQRVKVGFGVDGVFTDASATNPMPVSQTGPLEVTGPELRQDVLVLVELRLLTTLFAQAFNITDDLEQLRTDIFSKLG